jgi:hypothetical protein
MKKHQVHGDGRRGPPDPVSDDYGIPLTATSLLRQSRSHPQIFTLPLETPMDWSIHHLHHINHWALLVSALILWFLGAAWYSPALFAKPWMAALGIVPNGPKKGLAVGMISSFIGDLLVAFVLLHFILWSGAASFVTGAFVSFLCWLGFFAATQFPQSIYENRPGKLFAINTGYWLVGLLIIGGLLATWK